MTRHGSRISLLLAFSSLAFACDADSTASEEALFAPAPSGSGKADEIAGCEVPFTLEPMFGGVRFSQPVAMLEHPNAPGTFYVVERRGVVWRVASGGTAPTPVVDLRAQINAEPQEAGLLGMAFHPDFASNGQVFLSYTAPNPGTDANLRSKISRFVSHDGAATLDLGTEEVLLELEQPFNNHNGGQIEFGPDGFLYIAFGDGGLYNDPFGHGQDTSTLFGTLLRIDVNAGAPYGIPSDNPFVAGGGRPEIYAYGLRNPWRFSFDRASGTLLLADVGQDAWEEVNIIEKGGNYGWKLREGAHCRPPTTGCSSAGLVDPIAEYGRNEGVSITGGFLYRGDDIPALSGQYVFADFATGRFFALAGDGNGGVARRTIAQTPRNIASFAEDSEGELYAVDLFDGRVFALTPNEACAPTDGDGGTTDTGSSPGGTEPFTSVSFSDIYETILAPHCSGCHHPGTAGGLWMPDEATAYAALVGTDAESPVCTGGTRVIPGNAADSVLYRKVSGVDVCGSLMPPSAPLDEAQIQAIADWIDAGAQP